MNDHDLRSALDDLVSDLPGDRALPAATARRAARRRGLKLGAAALGGAGVVLTAAVVLLGVTAPADDRLLTPADEPTAGPSPSPSPSAASPSPTASPAPSPTALAPVTPTRPASPSPSQPAAPVRVVLRPDGLGFTGGGSSTSALPFGSDDATVRSAVDRALGEGTETLTPDCGSGSSNVRHEGLFLLLQDGVFVGWVTGSPGLTTGDGLGIGSTRAELRAALPAVRFSEGTLGPEWSTVEGGLTGFLDGTGSSSVVNSMAAGARCLAR